MNVAIAVLLTLFGVLTRLIPHPPNMVAFGALALYAGARLPRRWALAVPVVAMLASDILIDWGRGYSPLHGDYLMRYATFAFIVFMGSRLKDQTNPAYFAGFSLLASTLFFLTSNFAVWAFPSPAHPPLYPSSIDGLWQSYAAGLAFFKYQGWYQNLFLNSIIADLVGVGCLFGADALARRSVQQAGTTATVAIQD